MQKYVAIDMLMHILTHQGRVSRTKAEEEICKLVEKTSWTRMGPIRATKLRTTAIRDGTTNRGDPGVQALSSRASQYPPSPSTPPRDGFGVRPDAGRRVGERRRGAYASPTP